MSEETVEKVEAKLQKLIKENAPLKDVNRAYAELVLARHDGNKVHAAQALKIDRRSLQRWNSGAALSP